MCFPLENVCRQIEKIIRSKELEKILGLYALELDDKVFHAVHMFAVMSAYNSRKHAQIITDEDAVFNLIWEGHRTAQFYHKGLEKRYKGIWL